MDAHSQEGPTGVLTDMCSMYRYTVSLLGVVPCSQQFFSMQTVDVKYRSTSLHCSDMLELTCGDNAGFIPARVSSRVDDVGMAVCLQGGVWGRCLVWSFHKLVSACDHVHVLLLIPAGRPLPMEEVFNDDADGAILRMHYALCVRACDAQCTGRNASCTSLRDGQYVSAVFAVL